MKTIGLIGGMSWESTVTYYQVINRTVAERLGGLRSARIVLYSVDFDEIERCQSSGDWGRSAKILAEAARALERAGSHPRLHGDWPARAPRGHGCPAVRRDAHPRARGGAEGSRGLIEHCLRCFAAMALAIAFKAD